MKNKKLLQIFILVTFLFIVKSNTADAANACEQANGSCHIFTGNITCESQSLVTKGDLSCGGVGTCCLPQTGPTNANGTGNSSGNSINGLVNGLISGATNQNNNSRQATSPAGAGGIITCGKTAGSMCTLCDIIKGINTIIQYLLRIGIGVALASMTIGGVIYIVSAGDTGMMDMAKAAMKNAAIGLAIMFGAWLIISTTLRVIGTNSSLGISGVTNWGTFDCTAKNR